MQTGGVQTPARHMPCMAGGWQVRVHGSLCLTLGPASLAPHASHLRRALRCCRYCCEGMWCCTSYTRVLEGPRPGQERHLYTLKASLCCCGGHNNCCGATCCKDALVMDIMDPSGNVVGEWDRERAYNLCAHRPEARSPLDDAALNNSSNVSRWLLHCSVCLVRGGRGFALYDAAHECAWCSQQLVFVCGSAAGHIHKTFGKTDGANCCRAAAEVRLAAWQDAQPGPARRCCGTAAPRVRLLGLKPTPACCGRCAVAVSGGHLHRGPAGGHHGDAASAHAGRPHERRVPGGSLGGAAWRVCRRCMCGMSTSPCQRV